MRKFVITKERPNRANENNQINHSAMAEKKSEVTYSTLLKEIKSNKYRPVYVLHGEEAYYIDKLMDMIEANALSEDERDFNLTIAYGNEADVKALVAQCNSFPVMAERQVVILREAQNVGKAGNNSNLDYFSSYVSRPLESTVLVICYKHGTIPARSELMTAAKGNSQCAVMESKKVTEWNVRPVIMDYVKGAGCTIDEKSVIMLRDSVGTDLSRLFSEIDKLLLLVGSDQAITPELIERNIGISKDYNNFELEDALIRRDAAKAFKIIDYFEKNPKNNPAIVTVAMIYGFFSNLLVACTLKDKSPQNIAGELKVSPYRAKKIVDAMSKYRTVSCVNIISYLRECDAKMKGINSRQDSYALLRELIYKMLHS